jgi:hypothetical protein
VRAKGRARHNGTPAQIACLEVAIKRKQAGHCLLPHRGGLLYPNGVPEYCVAALAFQAAIPLKLEACQAAWAPAFAAPCMLSPDNWRKINNKHHRGATLERRERCCRFAPAALKQGTFTDVAMLRPHIAARGLRRRLGNARLGYGSARTH